MPKKRKPLTDKEIGERMRAARERTTMPQQHISNVMTMTRGHRWHQTVVAKVENGDRALKLTEAVEVADILGVPLSELTGDEPAATGDQGTAPQVYELLRLQGQITKRLHELGA